MEEKSNLPYLALVAVVAIVAVVMLVMNGGKTHVSETPTTEEAVAGEATRLTIPPLTGNCETISNYNPKRVSGDAICKESQKKCVFQEPAPVKSTDVPGLASGLLVYPRDCKEIAQVPTQVICCS